MSGSEGEPAPPAVERERGRARKLVDRVLGLRLRQLAIGLGALLLAVSGIFGGLKEARGPRLSAVAVQAIHRGKPWDVAVVSAAVLDQAPPRLRRERDRWLAVRAYVEISADESRRDLADVIQVVGVDGLDKRPADIHIARDKSSATLLHPALGEDLIFYWEQAEAAPVPAAIEVQIFGKKQRIDTFSGRRDWMDKAARARVMVPVEDQRKPS